MGMAGGGHTELRAVALSRNHVVSTPSSIRFACFTATPSASNGCERSPRLRSGSSTMRMPWRKIFCAELVLQEARLARDRRAVRSARRRWPISEPATRGSNTTGTLLRRHLARIDALIARSPALRPIFRALRGRVVDRRA